MLTEIGDEHALASGECIHPGARIHAALEPRLAKALPHVVVEAEVDIPACLIGARRDELIKRKKLIDRTLAAARRAVDDEAAVDVRTRRTRGRILQSCGGVVEELLMLVAREPEPRHPAVGEPLRRADLDAQESLMVAVPFHIFLPTAEGIGTQPTLFHRVVGHAVTGTVRKAAARQRADLRV